MYRGGRRSGVGPQARRPVAAQGDRQLWVAEHDLDKIIGLKCGSLHDFFWESHTMKLSAFIAPAMLSTALWATPLLASDFSGGNKGNGEAPRGDITDKDFSLREATPILPKLGKDEATRAAPITDEQAVIQSLAAVGKSADGKDLKVEASDKLKEIVKKMLNAPDNPGDAG